MVFHYHGGPTTNIDEGLCKKAIRAMYDVTGKINSL